jgi:uncharacterized delta-60 repeat protein
MPDAPVARGAASPARVLFATVAALLVGCTSWPPASLADSRPQTFRLDAPTIVRTTAQGKTVLAGIVGRCDSSACTDTSVYVGRLRASGEVDDSFGGGDGFKTIRIAPVARLEGLAVRPDGSVAVAAQAVDGDTDRAQGPILVMNLTHDGSLDTSFGNMGVAAIPTDQLRTPDSRIDYPSDLMAADGDDLVIVGIAGAPSTFQNGDSVAAARLTSDGQLDVEFGDNGVAQIAVNEADVAETASAVSIRPDGRILVGGDSRRTDYVTDDGGHQVPDMDYRSLIAAQFLPNGQPDPSFGDAGGIEFGTLSGSHNYPYTNLDAIADTVLLQSDGSAVLVGSRHQGRGACGAITLAKLTPDGQIDAAYGSGGISDLETFNCLQGTRAVATTDGSIFVAAHTITYNSDEDRSVIVGFTAAGVLNQGFGDQGFADFDIGPPPDRDFLSIAPLPKHRFVVGAGVNSDCHRGLAPADCREHPVVLAFGADGRPFAGWGHKGLTRLPKVRLR